MKLNLLSQPNTSIQLHPILTQSVIYSRKFWDPRHITLDPRHATLDPRRTTLDPRPSTKGQTQLRDKEMHAGMSPNQYEIIELPVNVKKCYGCGTNFADKYRNRPTT